MRKQTGRRSGIGIMGQMIGLVAPLLHIMLAAVLLGTAGYLCAIFLTILAGAVLVNGLASGLPLRNLYILLGVLAVMRGVLHYAEQYLSLIHI